MIQRINMANKRKYSSFLDFIQEIHDSDFYSTKDNNRVYIEDIQSLRELFRNSRDAFELESNGECRAFCLVWKSKGGDTIRHYLKLIAKDSKAASDLLRGFLWNVNLELFTKVNKHHKFLDVYKKYGFKFIGGRGKQILLKRDKFMARERFVHPLALEGREELENNEI